MFELIEEPLNAVAQPIGHRVVWDVDAAIALGRNDGFGPCFTYDLAEIDGVLGLVGNNATGGMAVQQVGS